MINNFIKYLIATLVLSTFLSLCILIATLPPPEPPQAPPYSVMPLHMTNAHQTTAQELQPTLQGTQLQ